MDNKCVFKGRLPSLNEYIKVLNSNRYQANNFKQAIENELVWTIESSKMRPVDKPCIVYVIFHEKDRRRDIDNIYSANKYILDSLRKAGIIKNDSQKYVKDVKDSFVADRENFVEIEIKEANA